jgi:hemin uptake protein HemP
METGLPPAQGEPSPAPHPASSGDNTSLRTLNSADLFQGAREVQIRHDEKLYRLQVTRNGKLILIK